MPYKDYSREKLFKKLQHQRFRDIVIKHYSKNTQSCACCGEPQKEFLTIDHKNQDGASHRKEVPTARLCKWLIDSGFPSGFQILCYNCNCARSLRGTVDGICPHQKQLTKITGLVAQ